MDLSAFVYSLGVLLLFAMLVAGIVEGAKVLWRWWCECLDGAANDIE